MDLGEAISTISVLKGRYQAIEKIDETLVFIQQQEAQLGDKKRELEGLKSEIHELQLARDILAQTKLDLEKDVASATKEKSDAVAERDARVHEAEKKFDAEMSVLMKENEDQKNALREDYTREQERYKGLKESLEKEIKTLETRRDSAKQMMAKALEAVQGG